ncbi:hypothetical protein DP939_03690 [Spongiactinospora rosea]|uniref:Uncharacterized protein n=1 Tax=Spongiactinospora rosea TaxID=2248750 RepID=A0A366M6B4_9ACTN|nr:hypothetical protein [Spongiactinospora rosea]RBQ21798.1 hypothetical protein DP939_03690 [Spongiactinospora rosea]
MTATGPEQVVFMESHGMPLNTESRKKFVEVSVLARHSYTSLADFIPGVDPYDFLTVVELAAVEGGGRDGGGLVNMAGSWPPSF